MAKISQNPVTALKQKLARLEQLRIKIHQARALYAEHDALVEELLPLFINQTDTGWTVARQISLGGKTYTFSPAFYDSKKGKLAAKCWKSAAFEVGRIA